MLLMFFIGVLVCLPLFWWIDNIVKPWIERKFQERADKEANVEYLKKEAKRIKYDEWVDTINSCTDVQQLWKWEIGCRWHHVDDDGIWDFGIDGKPALWEVSRRRSNEVKRNQYQETVQRAINRKTWLIEG